MGAGTAGSVLAARLTEQPDVRVRLLEAGPADGPERVSVPGAWPTLIGSEVDWRYVWWVGGAFWPRPPRAVRYAQAVSENPRIERGWIFVDGTRRDDGTIELGTGDEMRFSPFDAMSDRQDTHITWPHILKASVQRLAFWRR